MKKPKYTHGYINRHGKPCFYLRRPGKLGGRAQARPVALAELTRKPSLERFARLSVRLEEIEPAPPLGAKTATLSHERHITEERRFERQDVEARHVGPGIAALEDEKLDVARRGRHAP